MGNAGFIFWTSILLLIVLQAKTAMMLKTITTTAMTTTSHHRLSLAELLITRRSCMQAACATLLVTQYPHSSHANEISSSSSTIITENLIEAQTTLSTLLENYKKATVSCIYADVPRELLESKNKDLLLEKAATSALFDKSASIETCKTTNRIVRDYLGVTGKGPMVGIEKLIRSGLEYIEPNYSDDYISEFERFSQAYSKATSLSYTAGVADLDSVNNFSKDDVDELNRDDNSNLQQTQEAIKEAKGNLDRIILLLLNNKL